MTNSEKGRKEAMKNNMTTKTTLVLGGTGKTGHRVAKRLTARSLPVRIGSRSVPGGGAALRRRH